MKAAIISLGSESSKMTAEAMRKHFDRVDELQLRDIELSFQGTKAEILYQDKPIEDYDIYAKGSFRYVELLRSITSLRWNESYLPVEPNAFTIVHDKLLTQLELQRYGIPMPKTYLSATVPAAKTLVKNLKYPIIMKFPHGTHGKGVMYADTASSAITLLDAMDTLKQPVLIQEFIDTDGTDIRAFVVGDKVVAAMRRKGAGIDPRANLHSGGSATPIELDHHTAALAVKVARAVGADIAGVDILESHRGPVVLEANISPGLRGITSVTKIDIAEKIAKYLAEKAKARKKDVHDAGASDIMHELHVETGTTTNIITQIDMRGKRILLPEVVTKAAGLTENDTVEIEPSKGNIIIRKAR
jgi:ribosomal protein S6--L-glutamate ligase